MDKLCKSICNKCSLYRDCYDNNDFNCNDIKSIREFIRLSDAKKPVNDEGIIKCIHCQRELNEIWNFCPDCGQRIEK